MRSRRLLSAFGSAFLAASSAVGCVVGTADDTESSEAAHTAARAVEENRPEYWATTDYAEHRNQMMLLGYPLEGAAPDDDPLTVRFQTWLDRIDVLVRADVLRTSGKPLVAPKPIAKVIVSRERFNAWVSPVMVCLSAPVGAGETTTPMALLSSGSVEAISSTCARPGWDRAEYARFWNGAKVACKLAFAGDSFSVTGPSCQLAEAAKHANELVTSATSPFIHFSTDYIAVASEASFVSTIAHELGHFYMAHATDKATARYGYWYSTSGDQAGQPPRAPGAAELQAAYEEVAQGYSLERVGKTFSPRLRAFLVTTVHPLLAQKRAAEPTFACARAVDALSPEHAGILASTASVPPPDARAAYEAFERELAACAPRVQLKGADVTSSISAGQLLVGARAHAPGPKTKIVLRVGESLGDFLARFDTLAKELDAKAARLLALARKNKLGLYTTEQAADEFALELAVRLGFTVDEILAAWLDDMRAIEAVYRRAGMQPPPGEQAEACKALLDAEFTTVDGSGRRVPVMVSLGRLDEPHHSSCYRLFNSWREARAHRYVPAPKPAPLEPPWETLRAHATELTSSAPPPPAPSIEPAPPGAADAGVVLPADAGVP